MYKFDSIWITTDHISDGVEDSTILQWFDIFSVVNLHILFKDFDIVKLETT